MNLLTTLWGWLTSLFANAPAPAIEGQECCEEECEPSTEPIVEIHTKEEPTPVVVEEVEEPEPVEVVKEAANTATPVGDLLREVLLSRGISERVIEKYEIAEAFEGWYTGPLTADAIHASIQTFREEKGGVIKSKLSKFL